MLRAASGYAAITPEVMQSLEAAPTANPHVLLAFRDLMMPLA